MDFTKIGQVEQTLKRIREEGPFIIPQIDPDAFSLNQVEKILDTLEKIGVRIVTIGGTIIDPRYLNQIIEVAVRDHDFKVITYPNEGSSLIEEVNNSVAIYWMRVLNGNNPYFQDDFFVMNSLSIKKRKIEAIPTAYIFDERGSVGSSVWLARANPVPKDKPQIGLALAVGAEYSGTRVLILGGGSGAKSPPNVLLVKLIADNTDLFLIPTSGIRTLRTVEELFGNGADAVHIGKLLEDPDGLEQMRKLIENIQKKE